MGTRGGVPTKKSNNSVVPTNEIDLKSDVYAVWLLTPSDRELLENAEKQLRVKFEASVKKSDVNSCASYIRSLSDHQVLVIVSSKFMDEIMLEIASRPQVVSLISFYQTDKTISASISRINNVAGSETQLIDVINENLDRISVEQKCIEVVVLEETINRLVQSFGKIPIHGNYKKLFLRTVNYSISLDEVKFEFLRHKHPKMNAKIIVDLDGKDYKISVCATLKFNIDEPRNEISIDVVGLNAPELPFVKKIDLTEYFSNMLKPIKIRGPTDTVSYLPVNMPDGKSKKILHVRQHGLRYEIYDHRIVLSNKIEFTVDSECNDH